MGWRHDWLWILPPETTTEEIDRLFREMRWMRRRQRLWSWLRRVGNIR